MKVRGGINIVLYNPNWRFGGYPIKVGNLTYRATPAVGVS